MTVPRVAKLMGLVALVCVVIGCDKEGPATDPGIQAVDTVAGPLPDKGPDQYWVKLETTRGDVFVEVHRDWSPYGADRFYELVKSGFFDGCKFFRVAGFVVQFGINGDPQVSAKWRDKNLPDDTYQRRDPNRHSNTRGYLTFAKSQMPNSRSTQIFINCMDNAQLDKQGFTPFGIVLSGMSAIDSLYSGYGEEPTSSQERIQTEGDAYLNSAFPRLDSIKKAILLPAKPDLPKPADDEKKPSEPKPSAGPPAPAKKSAG
jgi:peptidyl-prolyl cis-trans isomerase A (cyclophilin A)